MFRVLLLGSEIHKLYLDQELNPRSIFCNFFLKISEAKASEFLENLKEVFPRYC